jgi:ADP-ribosyl-[dinitrogen reductase] hydrolase
MDRGRAEAGLRIDGLSIPGRPGLLGLTSCPGRARPGAPTGVGARLELDLAAIRDWGASLLLSLIEDSEFRELGIEDLGGRLPAGLAWLRLPIRDFSVPDADWETAWRGAAPGLLALLGSGGRLCLHCMGGRGRSGLVAARLLIESGIGPAEALGLVRRAREGAVETPAQEAYVLSLGWQDPAVEGRSDRSVPGSPQGGYDA